MRLLAALPVLLAAAPALAHTGAHLHPHGIGEGWAVLAASVVIGVAGIAYAKVRK